MPRLSEVGGYISPAAVKIKSRSRVIFSEQDYSAHDPGTTRRSGSILVVVADTAAENVGDVVVFVFFVSGEEGVIVVGVIDLDIIVTDIRHVAVDVAIGILKCDEFGLLQSNVQLFGLDLFLFFARRAGSRIRSS